MLKHAKDHMVQKKSARTFFASKESASADSPYSLSSVKSAAWHYVVGRILTGGAGFAYLIFLVRAMDPEPYAVYLTMIGYAATVGLLSGVGLDKVIARYVPEGRLLHAGQELNSLVISLLVLKIVALSFACIVTYLFWSFVASVLFQGLDHFPWWLIPLIISYNIFQFLSIILQTLIQQRLLTVVLAIQWSVRLGAVVLMQLHGMHIGISAAILISVLPDLVGTLALTLTLRKHLHSIGVTNCAYTIKDRWPPTREMAKISLHNYGYAWLIAAPQGNFVLMIAATLVVPINVAAYGFFSGLIDRIKMYLPLMLLFNLLEPVFTANYMQDKDFTKLCNRALILYKINFYFVIFLAVSVSLVAPQLTSILTNGKYLAFSYIFPVILIQIAIASHNVILQMIINNIGRSEFLSASGSVALISMAATLIIIITTGEKKYFFCAPVIYELSNTWIVIFLMKLNNIEYPSTGKFHLKIVLISIGSYITCRLLFGKMSFSALFIFGNFFVVFVLFLAAGYFLSVLRSDEWEAGKYLFQKKCHGTL